MHFLLSMQSFQTVQYILLYVLPLINNIGPIWIFHNIRPFEAWGLDVDETLASEEKECFGGNRSHDFNNCSLHHSSLTVFCIQIFNWRVHVCCTVQTVRCGLGVPMRGVLFKFLCVLQYCADGTVWSGRTDGGGTVQSFKVFTIRPRSKLARGGPRAHCAKLTGGLYVAPPDLS